MQFANAVGLLDRLIEDATETHNNPLDLLLEHLQAARRYLLANAAFEYRMSLSEAVKSLDCIAVKSDRQRLKASLQSLEHPSK